MNKSELTSAIADRSGQPPSAVTAVLDAFEAVVTDAVKGGDKVALTGFLTFEKAERAARTGRNPATGESIDIAAATVPKVKVGKAFKDAVGG